jgi:hypothetical protein
MCLTIDLTNYRKPHDTSKFRWKVFGDSKNTSKSGQVTAATRLENRYRKGLVTVGEKQIATRGGRPITPSKLRNHPRSDVRERLLSKYGLHVYVERRSALDDNRNAGHVCYLAKVKVSGHIASGHFDGPRCETWHKYQIVELWEITRSDSWWAAAIKLRTKLVWRAKRTGGVAKK